MNIYLNKEERKMLLASARSFYAMDKDYVYHPEVRAYDNKSITPDTLKRWKQIINKLKKRKGTK